MTSLHWKLVGIVALVLLAFIAASCAVEGHGMRQCMRGSFHQVFGFGLQVGSLALGAWVGVESAKWSARPWVGWVTGLAIWWGLVFLFSWLGLAR